MNRDEVIETLRAHRETLAERFGVRNLALFGSYASGTAIDASDVDILAEFDPAQTGGTTSVRRPTLRTSWGGRSTSRRSARCARRFVATWRRTPSVSDEPGDSREWCFYIEDMLRFTEKALAYTEGLDQAAFVADERTYDATLRNIELMGRPPHTSRPRSRMPTPAYPGTRSSEPVTASPTAICTPATAWSGPSSTMQSRRCCPELRDMLGTAADPTGPGE